jgi:hypothetical protein
MIIAKYDCWGIKITLVDNGSTLNMCSVSLLGILGVDKSRIQLNSLSIRGFDNVGKQSLCLITLPIIFGKATLKNHIHVTPNNLSYNILLG